MSSFAESEWFKSNFADTENGEDANKEITGDGETKGDESSEKTAEQIAADKEAEALALAKKADDDKAEANKAAAVADEAGKSTDEDPDKDKGAGKTAIKTVKEQYDEWFTTNEDTLAKYYSEKSTDYKSLAPEILVKMKMKEDRPSLSQEDIDQLFEDEYELSEKIVIDEDEMTPSEVKEAKAFNNNIDKMARKLAAQAKEVASEFEARKESLTKPIFEAQVAEASEDGDVVKYTKDELTAESVKEAEARLVEWGETVDKFGVLDKLSYRDLEVEVTPEEGEQIASAMKGYVAQAGDIERFSENGEFKMELFAAHVAKSVLLDKLIDTAKATVKGDISDKLKNFSNNPSNEKRDDGTMSEASETEAIWASMKGK